MATPQPDIFLKWSKELYKAKLKTRIPGVANQVFEAIVYLTYGGNPSVKSAQIQQKKIGELTGLNAVAVSKAMAQLLNMNLVTKNGNYHPPIIGINKDYDSWKELPKKVTSSNGKGLRRPSKKRVTKNGNCELPKMVTRQNSTLYTRRIKNTSDFLYDFYKKQISPLRKSSERAKKNIRHFLKKYDAEDLKKCILNYKKIIDNVEPKYRKDPANFFGKLEKYFIDYLPDNFEEPKDSYEQDNFYRELT